jgi:hypothetical protein
VPSTPPRPWPGAAALALLALACSGAHPNSSAAPAGSSAGGSAGITAADLKTRLSIYADDSMQGR